MFTYHISRVFIFSASIAISLLVNDNFVPINSESVNGSFVGTFSPAVATWYDSPTGPGSGAACGFANDVGSPPYYGLTAAGNNNIFKKGEGCGACYQLKCTEHPSCSRYPITVTITNECPGACNNEAFHFDLSGKAFGDLAKPGQADKLRQAGRINIQYQRIQCHYRIGITVKIDTSSNPNYLAFAIEDVSGDGDTGSVELSSSNSKGWISMKQSWGDTWSVGLPVGLRGPYSIRITTVESRKKIVATSIIPPNWAPGQYYHSRVNIRVEDY